MTNAKRDHNYVPTKLGTSNADGKTLMLFYADPNYHSLLIEDGTGGTDHGPAIDKRDDNSVPAAMAASSTDAVTPVALYLDSANNNLLVKST